MCSLWLMALLLLHLCAFSVLGYKLPFQDNSDFTSFVDTSMPEPGTSLFHKAINFKLTAQYHLKQKSPKLSRIKRDDSTEADLLDLTTVADFSKETLSDVTQNTVQATSFTVSTPISTDHTTTILSEDETSFTSVSPDKSLTEVNNRPHTDRSSSPTQYINETTGPSHTTVMSSPKNTTVFMVEDDTSTQLSEISSNPSVISTVVRKYSSTEPDDISTMLPTSSTSSTGSSQVTHMTYFTEHGAPFHSLMKQCMLVILILAIVCTIFIISTIALAAKLSTMRHQQKKRQENHTEMMCISSLLPESDQQSKVKLKKMKTFAANIEESDGDNTTLNSFLPDH
ncbi:P-selectin glycoprotein ligand 1 [Bombina bombina]|uniref:P-selectin glycoprotein ligand 1 n=1 Tax=Bombina bombina TaxID=8345 RepID=UPI00235A52CE|nr:P-selectin glycoprotein ligand 1 [Bombina bombina]